MKVKNTKSTKFQIYLPELEEAALRQYIEDKFLPNSHGVYTIVFRKAVVELLKKEGYLK